MTKQYPILIPEKDNFAALNGELIHNTQSRYAEYREETNPEHKKAIKEKFNIKLKFTAESLIPYALGYYPSAMALAFYRIYAHKGVGL